MSYIIVIIVSKYKNNCSLNNSHSIIIEYYSKQKLFYQQVLCPIDQNQTGSCRCLYELLGDTEWVSKFDYHPTNTLPTRLIQSYKLAKKTIQRHIAPPQYNTQPALNPF